MLAEILNNQVISSLNQNEQAILQYIYTHANDIKGMSIQDLSRELSVSTATIIRFSHKIGMSGFSELKFVLNEEANRKAIVYNSEELEYEIKQDILKDVESTLLLMKDQEMKEVIDELNSDKSIHLFSGGGISGRVLDYLEKMLLSYGRQNVYRYEASRLAFHIAETLTERDVLFVISASGSYEPTIKMASIAKIHKAKTIAISPFSDNLLANIVDISFRFFGRTHINGNTEYSSRLPIFFLIDTMFKVYADSKKERLR